MLTGMKRTAQISTCGRYRSKLTRRWDDRPTLLVVMFNPSTADGEVDDQTIILLCHIAANNGFGAIVVVNGIPLRSSNPREAAHFVLGWESARDWYARDALNQNLGIIETEVGRSGAVLLAWGALADLCPYWFNQVEETIYEALPDGVPVYCLGRTAGGHPKHPMARGTHKVPKDARLIPWALHSRGVA